jgi:hypothetical protein
MRILTRKEFQDDMAKAWSEAVHAEYKAQIEAAVLAEREECAKILDANAMACHTPIMRSLLQANAQAIRARGQA